MEVIYSFKTMGTTYKTVRPHNLEYHNPQNSCSSEIFK
jgi:hypothetical protein